jgi:thiamine-monophosphate kinase
MREFELIEKLLARLPDAPRRVRIGPGDDAAVVVGDGELAVTVDALIEGVHFRLDSFPPAAVGRKAIAAALSDLAAMGAEAGEVYVALGLPPKIDEATILALQEGIAEAAEAAGVAVVGGDVNRASELILSVTAVGRGEGVRMVSRGGAEPGDVAVVTGELGGAAAGLLLLTGEVESPELPESTLDALRARQLSPTPRLGAGRALADAGARAMIDISDGLGADAAHVAATSGVALRIELRRVPIQAGVHELADASGGDPFELACAGEDYELLACLPRDRLADAEAAVEDAGSRLTPVGEALGGEGVELIDLEGLPRPLGGFDHLASS